MNSTSWFIKTAWILPMLSLGIEVPPDSSQTSIAVAVGEGSYALVSRGCDGKPYSAEDVPIAGASATVEHMVSEHFGFGLKVDGVIRKKKWSLDQQILYNSETDDYESKILQHSSAILVTPLIFLESKNIGLTVGNLITTSPLYLSNERLLSDEHSKRSNAPAFRLRLGPTNEVYLVGSVNMNAPMFVGGGQVDFGIGLPMRNPDSRLWIGSDAGPFDGAGVLIKFETPMTENFFLTGAARYGRVAALTSEYTVSIGLRYRWWD
jgi:hypothetical protein